MAKQDGRKHRACDNRACDKFLHHKDVTVVKRDSHYRNKPAHTGDQKDYRALKGVSQERGQLFRRTRLRHRNLLGV